MFKVIFVVLLLHIAVGISAGVASVDCPIAVNSNGNLEGGLVKAEISGTVGKLLIDIPDGLERDLVASAILSENDKYWDKVGKLQVHYTDGRFQSRKYFSPGGDALSLPDDSLFTFTWLGPARRVAFNSSGNPADTPALDSIVRDYIMTVVIVSDVGSIAVSDPALGIVGQSISEYVDVPLDPHSFIERGNAENPQMKACLVESNFPKGSWSTSKPYAMFLDYCFAASAKPADATEGECLYCHCTLPYPTLDCYRALELATGRVTLVSTFTRIPWSNLLYNKWKFLPNGSPSQGANLVPFQRDLRQVYVKYRFFDSSSPEVRERCVGNSGWRKLVTFNSVDANNGKTAFHLGAVNFHVDNTGGNPTFQRDGLFYLDPAHGHYHTPFYSNFTATGKYHTITTNDTKRGFCLISNKRVVNDIWAPWNTPYSACDYQGITSGSADIYGEGIPCQWIDITEMPAGKIDLAVKINAWDALCEGFVQCNASDLTQILTEETNLVATTDDYSESSAVRRPVCRHLQYEMDYLDDNGDSVKFDNRGAGESVITDTESQYGRHQEIGLRRNNEFELYGEQLRSCVLNTTVTLSCKIPSSQSNLISQIIRVCESSVKLDSALGCLFNDALASGLIAPGAVNSTVSFLCPGPRNSGNILTSEPGGFYSLYRAHNDNSLASGKPDVQCVAV